MYGGKYNIIPIRSTPNTNKLFTASGTALLWIQWEITQHSCRVFQFLTFEQILHLVAVITAGSDVWEIWFVPRRTELDRPAQHTNTLKVVWRVLKIPSTQCWEEMSFKIASIKQWSWTLPLLIQPWLRIGGNGGGAAAFRPWDFEGERRAVALLEPRCASSQPVTRFY